MSNKKKQYSELSALGMVISLIGLIFLSCCGGYMHWSALPSSVVGIIFAWVAFFRYENLKLHERAVIWISVIVTSLILFKNIGDVFLWGHP